MIQAINFSNNETVEVGNDVEKIEKHNGCFEVYYTDGRITEVYNVNWMRYSKED